MLRKHLIATAIALTLGGFPLGARAVCPSITSGLNLTVGGPTVHVTYINSGTCAQVGPAGVTVTNNAAIATVAPDATATGFVVSPVAPGSFTLSLAAPGFATASVGVAVVAGTMPTAITNP